MGIRKANSKRNARIIFGISIIIIFALIIKVKINEKNLNANKCEAIGTPLKIWYINFNYKYDYEFYVNGVKYEGRSDYTLIKPAVVLKTKYKVEYEKDNPKNSHILFDSPIEAK